MDERRTCWQTVDDNKIREENQHGQKVCVLWKKNTRCCLFKQETDLLTAKRLWRFPVWRMVLLFTNRFLLWNLLYVDMQPLWDGDCRLKYDCWTVTECKYKKLGLVGGFFGVFFLIRCCELSALDATDSEAIEWESRFICAVRAS